MTLTTVSCRDFARDLANAKRAADAGPVFVTDRGRPTYALLKIEDDYKLFGTAPTSLLDKMDAIPGHGRSGAGVRAHACARSAQFS